jgi:hypothetical protein
VLGDWLGKRRLWAGAGIVAGGVAGALVAARRRRR